MCLDRHVIDERVRDLNAQLLHNHLTTTDVIGDGNCFFRALSVCLYGHENEQLSIQHCARLLLIIYVPPSSMSRRLIVMHCFVRSLTSPVMVHGLARMSLLRLRNTCNVSSMFTSLPARPLRVYTLHFINLRSAQPHRHFSSHSTSRAIFARFATWTLLIKLVMTTLSRFLAAKVVLTYLKVTALAQLII